jgi:tetratricopeptide (TPR) repeat protein
VKVKWVSLLLAAALMLNSSTGRAADPAELVRSRLAEAEQRYADQEYRAAIEACHAVLSDPVATRDQRARAYEYLGLSWLILGKRARARDAFENLVAIDPQYTLSDPSRSPKLRQFFDEVRASFVPGYQRGSGEAELEHAAPSGAVAGRPLEVAAVATRGAPLVAEVTLHARRQGLLQFTVEKLREEGGRFTLSFVPPREAGDYLLEYYLEAHDAKGRVIARVASPERPIALPVRGVPVAATPWYKRWYVWAAVGGVVAAVAIGATVAATAQHAPSGTLPPGQVSLGIRF